MRDRADLKCNQCGELALKCECAKNAGEMAIKIYQAIDHSDPKIMAYTPDALIRVLVYLCKCNGWTEERTQKEVEVAIKYYYLHE